MNMPFKSILTQSILGLLVAGPTADALGVSFWWVITGIMIFVMGGGALFVPAIVHIEDPASWPRTKSAVVYDPVQGQMDKISR